MQKFEYKVVPAPRRGEKSKAARTTPDRFALTLTLLMNDLGRDGWDYLRADTLPCEERVGFTGKATTFQNMLVFRRVLTEQLAEPEPAPAPVLVAKAPQPAERALADYAGLAPRPVTARPLTSDAPAGEAPRISLVPSLPASAPSVGPAAGNGLAKV